MFVANLLHAAADRAARVSVILTLRSDFLPHTQRHAALNQAIAAHGVIVPAMDAAALRLAIVEPAARANHPFDTATVDLLLAATAGQAGALPLLQFALTRIWEWLAQGVAPADTLRHIGGVGGALAGEARRLYDSLSGADKAIAQRAFLGLVRLGAGMPDTRRRIAVADLSTPGDNLDHVRQVLRLFARPGTRLITFAADVDGTETVEITHEVLFEHWEALQTCLARSRADLLLPHRVDDEVQSYVDDKVQTAFVPAPVYQAAGGSALGTWQAHQTATQERERAETARHSAAQERDKARRRLNDVRTLANAFMFDFQDAIEPLAGATPARMLVVKKALEYLDSLAQEAHDDASLPRDLGLSYSKIGDTLAAIG